MTGLLTNPLSEQAEVGGFNMDVMPHLRTLRPATLEAVTVRKTAVDEAHARAVARAARSRFLCLCACSLLCVLPGCTAFRPLKGIPVRQLPMDLRVGESRANMETIDLSRLGQTPPAAHLIDSGDVLAIYVEGVLGKLEDAPPVYLPQTADSNPSFGYPIPVREDGTISLPLIGVLSIRGMTVMQVENLVRKSYTVDQQILEKGRERILVSLQKSRSYKITVLRQETSNAPLVSIAAGGAVQLGQSKKGTGQVVVLQAGENDVLHALTLSGGLPGLDAQNAIYVLRRPRTPVQPVQRPLAINQSATKRTASVIQLTSGQSPYAGRYNFATQPRQQGVMPGAAALPPEPEPLVQPPWGHSVPQQDAYQAVQLEQPREAVPYGNAPAPASYRQGVSQPIPLRQPTVSPSMPPANQEPQPAPPGDYEGDYSGGYGGAYCPAELQPYMSSGTRILRIPIRLHPGEQAAFSEPDIVLYDGDIVFIESRDTEIFYTDGLLGGGQYQLPRDYDIDVLDAISIAQGRQMQGGQNGGFGSRIGGIAAVNQDISVSASNLVIIRRLADGGRINIKVDLNRALRDQDENLMIQPGDHLILRYKPLEAIGAFIERNLLAGSLIGLATQQTNGN